MSKAFAEAGSNSAFRRGVDPLATVGIYTSFKTVERVSERVGGKVAHDRHGPFARVDAAKEAPPNPPPVLVLEADGMRVRLTADQTEHGAQTAADEPQQISVLAPNLHRSIRETRHYVPESPRRHRESPLLLYLYRHGTLGADLHIIGHHSQPVSRRFQQDIAENRQRRPTRDNPGDVL